jgi:hypothetical protein
LRSWWWCAALARRCSLSGRRRHSPSPPVRTLGAAADDAPTIDLEAHTGLVWGPGHRRAGVLRLGLDFRARLRYKPRRRHDRTKR